LEGYGFKLPEEWAFSGRESSLRLHEQVGEGKWLSLSLYQMESGRFEVVAYVS
jgi:hypothetical protein